MFPGEMIILLAIAMTRGSGKGLLTHPMDVTSEYIGYLYNSLVKRGYLTTNGQKGYQLTTKGSEALFEFLRENRAKVKITIGTLQKLGIEVSQDIDKLETVGQKLNKLEKEAIKVK